MFCPNCDKEIDIDTNFCKFCGKEISKNNLTSTEIKPIKFYQTQWFLWIMLIFFTPIGIFSLWKFNKTYKTRTKIILTIIIAFIYILSLQSNETSTNSVNKYQISNKVKIGVTDFSSLTKQTAMSWCESNKVNCYINTEYSNNIKSGKLIKQSKAANKKINQGDKLTLIYSIGEKPSMEYENALAIAKNYAEMQHMSKHAIYNQLISPYGEKFTKTEAQYAINNL